MIRRYKPVPMLLGIAVTCVNLLSSCSKDKATPPDSAAYLTGRF